MLFDLEDYATTGVIGGKGRWSPYRGARNWDWEDLYTTYKWTRMAHIRAVIEYFLSAIGFVDNSRKPEALQKYHAFVDSVRAVSIAANPFWNMTYSFHLKFVPNGVTFSNGDRYDIVGNWASTKHDPISLMRLPQEVNQGWCSWTPDHTRPGMKKYITGEKYYPGTMRAVRSSEGYYTYQEFDNSIRLAYIEALEQMMSAEKQLIEHLEGSQFRNAQ